MSSLIRLNKVLARAGICSRRKADELIASGQIMVNDVRVCEPGIKVDPESDRILFQGRRISHNLSDAELIYVALNKPVQVVTTVSDPQGRSTVIDLIPQDLNKYRLFPAGRLDYFSQGLIILTNDGDIVHRLTHPSWNHPKVYELIVRQKPDRQAIKTMTTGMTLKDGQRLAPVKADIIKSGQDRTVLELTLVQGINRQIRRMCSDLGLTILRLTRIRHGPIRLGNLQPGKCRILGRQEIQDLKNSLGLTASDK